MATNFAPLRKSILGLVDPDIHPQVNIFVSWTYNGPTLCWFWTLPYIPFPGLQRVK